MRLTRLKTLMTGAALTALIAGGAFAQSTTTAENPMGTASENTIAPAESLLTDDFDSMEEMTVGDMVGMVAYDPEGDRIGDIDYVVNQADGAKAVVGIGGFIGLGEYTVALALDEFELNQEADGFTLDTDKETLKAQPEFDESGVEGLPDDTPLAGLMETDSESDSSPERAPARQPDDPATDNTMDRNSMDEPGSPTMEGTQSDTRKMEEGTGYSDEANVPETAPGDMPKTGSGSSG